MNDCIKSSSFFNYPGEGYLHPLLLLVGINYVTFGILFPKYIKLNYLLQQVKINDMEGVLVLEYSQGVEFQAI